MRLGIKIMGKSWGIKLACSWESQEPVGMAVSVRTRVQTQAKHDTSTCRAQKSQIVCDINMMNSSSHFHKCGNSRNLFHICMFSVVTEGLLQNDRDYSINLMLSVTDHNFSVC